MFLGEEQLGSPNAKLQFRYANKRRRSRGGLIKPMRFHILIFALQKLH